MNDYSFFFLISIFSNLKKKRLSCEFYNNNQLKDKVLNCSFNNSKNLLQIWSHTEFSVEITRNFCIKTSDWNFKICFFILPESQSQQFSWENKEIKKQNFKIEKRKEMKEGSEPWQEAARGLPSVSEIELIGAAISEAVKFLLYKWTTRRRVVKRVRRVGHPPPFKIIAPMSLMNSSRSQKKQSNKNFRATHLNLQPWENGCRRKNGISYLYTRKMKNEKWLSSSFMYQSLGLMDCLINYILGLYGKWNCHLYNMDYDLSFLFLFFFVLFLFVELSVSYNNFFCLLFVLSFSCSIYSIPC